MARHKTSDNPIKFWICSSSNFCWKVWPLKKSKNWNSLPQSSVHTQRVRGRCRSAQLPDCPLPKLRSKKHYHRIFFPFIDLTVVTCWLLYRRDCDDLGPPKKKQLPLLTFKNDIAEALYKEGKATGPSNRVWSLFSVEGRYEAKKARGHNSKDVPQQAIRKDNTDHVLIYMEKRGRCSFQVVKEALAFLPNVKFSLHRKNAKLFPQFSQGLILWQYCTEMVWFLCALFRDSVCRFFISVIAMQNVTTVLLVVLMLWFVNKHVSFVNLVQCVAKLVSSSFSDNKVGRP